MEREKGMEKEHAHEKHQSFEASCQWAFKSLISWCFVVVFGVWMELSFQECVAAPRVSQRAVWDSRLTAARTHVPVQRPGTYNLCRNVQILLLSDSKSGLLYPPISLLVVCFSFRQIKASETCEDLASAPNANEPHYFWTGVQKFCFLPSLLCPHSFRWLKAWVGGISGVKERTLIVLILLQGPSEEEVIEGRGLHVGYIFNRSLFWLLGQFNWPQRSKFGCVNERWMNAQPRAEETGPSSQTLPEHLSGRIIMWCAQAPWSDPCGQLSVGHVLGEAIFLYKGEGWWGPRPQRLFLNPINLLIALPVLSLEL